MQFRRIAGKTKAYTRSTKRYTTTSPKLSSTGCSDNSLHAESEKKGLHDLPLAHCVDSDLMCSCVKKYGAVTVKQIKDYNAATEHATLEWCNAKEQLDHAIDLFKNNPHVYGELMNVKNNVCQKNSSWDCPPEALANRWMKRFLINSLKIGGSVFVSIYCLHSFDCLLGLPLEDAFCWGGGSLPICFMAAVGRTIYTDKECVAFDAMSYHMGQETNLINNVLKKVTEPTSKKL
jgi:hypothetical protein